MGALLGDYTLYLIIIFGVDISSSLNKGLYFIQITLSGSIMQGILQRHRNDNWGKNALGSLKIPVTSKQHTFGMPDSFDFRTLYNIFIPHTQLKMCMEKLTRIVYRDMYTRNRSCMLDLQSCT